MALTPSKMLALGTAAPAFELPDAFGKVHALSEARGAPVLVMFICNHCPYVKHVAAGLASLCSDYSKRGLRIFGINSNDWTEYPDDSPEMMKAEQKARGYDFPYLADESQKVARAYDAACTPDFFLFDARHKLVYRGQMDESRPGNGIPVSGKDLRAAIDALLAGRALSQDQRPSVGCNIKWKRGG